MTGNVISAHADDSPGLGPRLLEQHGIKHLPVMDRDGNLAGIISDRDLKRASTSDAATLEVHEPHYLLDKVKLSEVMTKSPLTTTPGTGVRKAAGTAVRTKWDASRWWITGNWWKSSPPGTFPECWPRPKAPEACIGLHYGSESRRRITMPRPAIPRLPPIPC